MESSGERQKGSGGGATADETGKWQNTHGSISDGDRGGEEEKGGRKPVGRPAGRAREERQWQQNSADGGRPASS